MTPKNQAHCSRWKDKTQICPKQNLLIQQKREQLGSQLLSVTNSLRNKKHTTVNSTGKIKLRKKASKQSDVQTLRHTSDCNEKDMMGRLIVPDKKNGR